IEQRLGLTMGQTCGGVELLLPGGAVEALILGPNVLRNAFAGRVGAGFRSLQGSHHQGHSYRSFVVWSRPNVLLLQYLADPVGKSVVAGAVERTRTSTGCPTSTSS